jgi:predicted alpha/beta superfamily hydrolase
MNWQDYTSTRTDHTVTGTLLALPDFESPQLHNQRDILVYLPGSYETGDRRYPVLYMHDGQNLFDARTSFAGEWQVDEAMQRLAGEGIEAIVVGIPNMNRARMDEYSPFRDLRHGGGKGDRYLEFLVETLKPRIDADFRTLPGRAHTGLMGSSMGALISLYGFFRHADVFGFAGAMSPAFWFAGGALFAWLLRQSYVPGKIYLDAGTAEVPRRFSRLLPRYIAQPVAADARRAADILVTLGYRLSEEVVYVEDEGAAHNETAWARRLPDALRFLLG